MCHSEVSETRRGYPLEQIVSGDCHAQLK
ncbi:MAG: hypothetical protein ACD_62C00119G0003, partial [uncultured bacterium]